MTPGEVEGLGSSVPTERREVQAAGPDGNLLRRVARYTGPRGIVRRAVDDDPATRSSTQHVVRQRLASVAQLAEDRIVTTWCEG